MTSPNRPLGPALAALASSIVAAAALAMDGPTAERFSLPTVPFVESRGHAPRLAFSAAGPWGAVGVSAEGQVVTALSRGRARTVTLTETFEGGRARPIAGVRAATRLSAFIGNDPRQWQRDVATYETVSLGEVWTGIGLILRARPGGAERVFSLRPGARVERIRIRVQGASRVVVGGDGSLRLITQAGEAALDPPYAYQDVGGRRLPVTASYVVNGATYGFRLGRRNRTLPVVIDPILRSSYVGGAGPDGVNAIAVDPSTGDVLVAGQTYSVGLPGVTTGAQPGNPGGVTGFIARFDASLGTLIHATYLGGSGGEEILGIAVAPHGGGVYVAGFTASSDFPAASRGAQRQSGGSDDGFVALLDPTLSQLLAASYFGGANADRIVAIAVHPDAGDVFVGGRTESDGLPAAAGGAQPMRGGDIDGFVARFDPTLGRLLQSTYLGGIAPDSVHALAIHPSSGEILVGGQTLGGDLPATEGGANQGQPGTGNWDAFVTRLDPSLARFLQTTYLGGAGGDDVRGIAVEPSTGEILVTGWTNFPDFPATAGGAQPEPGGGFDPTDYQYKKAEGFVARLNASLTALLQATYLGGGGDDFCWGIAVDPSSGDVVVAGETHSDDLPGTESGAQPSFGGGGDAFVARLDRTLTRLVRATYIGGRGSDAALAVAIHPSTGEILVAGDTDSNDFPAARDGAQAVYGGGSEFFGGDGFVSRLSPLLANTGLECVTGGDTLCVAGNRFRVQVAWRVPSRGTSGSGSAVALTQDTGYFWFFDPANVELVVKVLDARAISGRFWVFYGALSDVEYEITITDTRTQQVRTYSNPSGALASVADTAAFSAEGSAASPSPAPVGLGQSAELPAAPESACSEGGAILCLEGGRFQVDVDWAAPGQGTSGHAAAVPLTGDTGYFWFFDRANVELVVKVLDGRGINGHFWVFYGSLSNVYYTMRVTDTVTQEVRTYVNEAGTLASAADTSAF